MSGVCTLLGLAIAAYMLIRGDTSTPNELKAAHGQSCANWGECQRDLECHEGTCVTTDERRDRDEQRTLKEAAATAPPPVTGQSGRVPFSVKVRRSRDQSESFAQCAADERLVGGGCTGYQRVGSHGSSPEGFSEDDTLGARWRCTDGFTAYALCMWVPMVTARTGAGA